VLYFEKKEYGVSIEYGGDGGGIYREVLGKLEEECKGIF
jgi:hypothetical protein